MKSTIVRGGKWHRLVAKLAGFAVIAIAIVVIVVMVDFIRTWRQVQMMDDRLLRIERGMALEESREIMGGGGTSVSGPFRGFWDEEPLSSEDTNRVASAERYVIKTFYLPFIYEITYDVDGRVVGKHRYD